MFAFRRARVIGWSMLTLGVGGWAMAIDRESFEVRVEQAAGGNDPAAGLRALDALSAEALQAGRIDLRVLATAGHARLRLRSGDFSRVRHDLDEARAEARAGGWRAAEAWVNEAMADFWQAQGDLLAAAAWLEAAWSSAMAAVPAESDLAIQLLERMVDAREELGQPHLAMQARGWLALLTGVAGAPVPEVALQPTAMTVQVTTEEVGRARLIVANATARAVTGTLLVDSGGLVLRRWDSTATQEHILLRAPSEDSRAVPQSTAEGRRLTLRPGEARALILEVEPSAPPRPGVRRVHITWEAGDTSVASTAEFHFARARDLPATSVATACRVRLNPLLNVPVFMEVYHRGEAKRHIQDLLPITSRPCRVEVYEILADGSSGRHWLALDADGDGRYTGIADALSADRNDSGFPDVEFGKEKEVAALEIRLYPLAEPDGSIPQSFELSIALRDGGRWRQPADVSHLIETTSSSDNGRP